MLFTRITEHDKLLPVYINGIGIQENQESTFRPNGFPQYQWTYCNKGAGILNIGGKNHYITKGTGFFFSPNIPHTYHATEEPWETYWVTFDGSYLTTLLNLFHINPWEVFEPQNPERCLSLFQQMEKALQQDNIEKILDTSATLYQFLILLKQSKKNNATTTSNSKPNKLKPVIAYMEEHYTKEITLEELSNLIQVTTHHLCKLFRTTFGMSPFQYLIQLRLQVAKKILVQQPDLKIREIASAVGYKDVSYFCTIFKSHESVSPLQFRRLRGL
jgi:YesN/AraC family two-component response regulator